MSANNIFSFISQLEIDHERGQKVKVKRSSDGKCNFLVVSDISTSECVYYKRRFGLVTPVSDRINVFRGIKLTI